MSQKTIVPHIIAKSFKARQRTVVSDSDMYYVDSLTHLCCNLQTNKCYKRLCIVIAIFNNTKRVSSTSSTTTLLGLIPAITFVIQSELRSSTIYSMLLCRVLKLGFSRV